MEPTQDSAYLRGLAGDVLAFKGSLEHLLELFVDNTGLGAVGRGMAPAVFPRDGADQGEIRRRMSATGQAAGLASTAPRLTNMLIGVQGVGQLDPIANWNAMFRPKPVLEASDVLEACDQMLGRLEAMAREADASRPASTGPEAMHPLVWGAVRGLWLSGHLRQAVAAGADAVAGHVKTLTGRVDLLETQLYQEAFSNKEPEPGKPRLRWPGNPVDKSVITMNDGLRQFAPGAQMTIRNPAAHGYEMSQQEAIEQLAVLSLLARWVERCELQEAPLPPSP